MISRYFTRKTPKKYRYNEADPQQHLVYHMEQSLVGWCIDSHVAPSKLREMASHACRRHRVEIPEVHIVATKQRVFGWSCHEIYLNKNWHGDNYGVLLHELAHWIHGERPNEGEADHGPEWVAIYAELLDYYRFLPLKYFHLLCDEHGVEYV